MRHQRNGRHREREHDATKRRSTTWARPPPSRRTGRRDDAESTRSRTAPAQRPKAEAAQNATGADTAAVEMIPAQRQDECDTWSDRTRGKHGLDETSTESAGARTGPTRWAMKTVEQRGNHEPKHPRRRATLRPAAVRIVPNGTGGEQSPGRAKWPRSGAMRRAVQDRSRGRETHPTNAQRKALPTPTSVTLERCVKHRNGVQPARRAGRSQVPRTSARTPR